MFIENVEDINLFDSQFSFEHICYRDDDQRDGAGVENEGEYEDAVVGIRHIDGRFSRVSSWIDASKEMSQQAWIWQ